MVLRTRAILISPTGKILLVKVKGMEHYSLPGGKVDPRESTYDAIRREIYEELNITDWEPSLRFIVELPHINSFETYYVGEVSEDVLSQERTEHFLEELEDVGFFNLKNEVFYYPTWLANMTREEIFSPQPEYLGVKQ